LIFLAFIILIIYSFFTHWLKLGLDKNVSNKKERTTNHDIEKSDLLLSIIVPLRNESKRIASLLTALKTQTLSKSKYEIIFIDDQSDDNTNQLIQDFIGVNSDLNAHLYQVSALLSSSKKKAIDLGISKSKGKYIVQTDGDCKPNHKWLSSIYGIVLKNNCDLLILPVFIEKDNNYISSFDSMEYASLQAIGLGMASQEYPIICSASNLVYNRSFYESVKMNRSDENISSGDDIFLLQEAISGKYKIESFINEDVTIITPSVSDYPSFINQRKRWVSKNTSIKDPVYQSVAILGLITNIILVIAIIIKPKYGSSLILIKLIADYLLFKKYYLLINQPLSGFSFLINSILYPFYLIYIVIASYSTKNSWKGRNVKT